MKKLLTGLSVLTLGTTLGNLSNFCNTNIQKSNILNNDKPQKTEQDTIYIDENGKKITTNEHNLANYINIKEVVQIGFYKNEIGDIQVVQMPITIEKVPNKLPREITSLEFMFSGAKKFNQDISSWDTSNVIDMNWMFFYAKAFNQDLSQWNVKKVIVHYNFSYDSGIDNIDKLPKFKK